MDDNDMAELAALPAILKYLIENRKPKHDDSSDPAWRKLFEDAHYLSQRYGAVYARNKRD